VGAGSIARAHLAGLARLPAVEAVAVCDLSAALAEATAEEFRIARWYTDYERMLEETRPEVVHVTTTPASHYRLARAALDAGAHVFVEKPITLDGGELRALLDHAKARGRLLVEDHNCAFQRPVRRVLEWVRTGRLGTLEHVEVSLQTDFSGPGSRYLEKGHRHPSLDLPGGPLAEYLPHFASILSPLIGAHRRVHLSARRGAESPFPCDELAALVEGERATASLFASVRAGPDAFTVRALGSRMRALAGVWEPLLAIEETPGGPRPLVPFRTGLRSARAHAAAGARSLWQRLAGRPPVFEGMWDLLALFYAAVASGGPPPIRPDEILAVHALAAALVPGEGTACSS
jgi:predicted dehydrogenase